MPLRLVESVLQVLEADFEVDESIVQRAPPESRLEIVNSHRATNVTAREYLWELFVTGGFVRTLALLSLLAPLASCGLSSRGTQCGIAALAGPTMLLEEFTKPGATQSAAPDQMPPVLPVRMVAGQAQRGLVGQTDSGWVVGVDGPFPDRPVPGFGVLLSDPILGVQGVLLYEGLPIPGAPKLGAVHIGVLVVPLIGLETHTAGFQDSRCPLFPDSLRQ